MPGCILVGCRNSSAKKVKMCYFPRDNNIRAQWIKQIGIKDWSPTINSALCQVRYSYTILQFVKLYKLNNYKKNLV